MYECKTPSQRPAASRPQAAPLLQGDHPHAPAHTRGCRPGTGGLRPPANSPGSRGAAALPLELLRTGHVGNSGTFVFTIFDLMENLHIQKADTVSGKVPALSVSVFYVT